MERTPSLEGLGTVWKRVEASRPKLEGSAELMPRKKPRGHPLKPFPPYGEKERTIF
ncbi:MAG: hypothetical protein IJQ43_03605 [Oscillospiraceae bacterium]|nr:hypothetical protein [Oscillospiraceae bacterium]